MSMNRRMIDIVGIVIVFIVGSILILAGSNMPDQSSIILENTEKITKLTTESWNCGEDTQCQKSKTDAIHALEKTVETYEMTQNIRDSLIMWGIIIDGLVVSFGILIGLSKR